MELVGQGVVSPAPPLLFNSFACHPILEKADGIP